MPGVAVLQNDLVTGAQLIDISVGGMKVISERRSPQKSHLVQFKFLKIHSRLAPNKPIKAKLVHSELNHRNGTYVLGFRFVELNEVQKSFLDCLVRPRPNMH